MSTNERNLTSDANAMQQPHLQCHLAGSQTPIKRLALCYGRGIGWRGEERGGTQEKSEDTGKPTAPLPPFSLVNRERAQKPKREVPQMMSSSPSIAPSDTWDERREGTTCACSKPTPPPPPANDAYAGEQQRGLTTTASSSSPIAPPDTRDEKREGTTHARSKPTLSPLPTNDAYTGEQEGGCQRRRRACRRRRRHHTPAAASAPQRRPRPPLLQHLPTTCTYASSTPPATIMPAVVTAPAPPHAELNPVNCYHRRCPCSSYSIRCRTTGLF